MNENIEKIEDLGWDDFFESKKTELGLGDLVVARVVAEHRGGYKVRNEKGEYVAKIRGKQMYEATSREDFPAVGDWVLIKELGNNQAVIQKVLPRKSVIKRRFGDRNKAGDKKDVQIIATNIEVAFLVQSVGRDYSVNRFERYLAIAKEEGIIPVVILNKIDLISQEELSAKLEEIKNRLGDIEVIATSTINSEGLEKLKNYIEKGKTYCFLGSSGVGKSTLINKLLENDSIKTTDISAYSQRGKHTTTGREMYFLPTGGILIDNPGIREVGIIDVSDGVDSIFEEISRLAENCRYADCTHTHEPGCEVLAALQKGRLDADKFANYASLKKETQYFEMNDWEKKEKERNFGKFLKKMKKDLKNTRHKDF